MSQARIADKSRCNSLAPLGFSIEDAAGPWRREGSALEVDNGNSLLTSRYHVGMHHLMFRLSLIAAVGWILLTPSPGRSQAERFEVGQRLRRFERAWAEQAASAARKRSLPAIHAATKSFFSFRLSEVARQLDLAWFALHSEMAASDDLALARAYYPKLSRRVVDPNENANLAITFEKLYVQKRNGSDLTASIDVREPSRPSAIKPAIGDLSKPIEIQTQGLAEGDLELRYVLSAGDKSLTEETLAISAISNVDARLQKLRVWHDRTESVRSTERATVEEAVRIVTALREGKSLETNYPAMRLLRLAEACVQAEVASKRVPLPPGQSWIVLADFKQRHFVRLQIPMKPTSNAPPLVVALHGAGGSENLFFDGYGDGLIAKFCEKEGWLLVAPRSPIFGGRALDDLLDTLQKRVPFDARRVFLVGHSMGAGQAIADAQKHPERITAVAALGGGGSVAKTARIQKIPFYVAVGDQDFALAGARSLRKGLQAAKVETIRYHELPEIEHLLIVQESLPNVFDFFRTLR